MSQDAEELQVAASLYGARQSSSGGVGPKSMVDRFREGREMLKEELENYEVLHQLEKACAPWGVSKLDILSWIGMISSFSVIFGFGAHEWSMIVGFIYPAFATFQAMAKKDDFNKSVKARWTTYWVMLAFLTNLEMALGDLLLRIVPFYYPLKFGLLVWSQSPQKKGSLFIYSHVLAPFLKCHQAVPALVKQGKTS